MKVECYPDGEGHRSVTYDLNPEEAAALAYTEFGTYARSFDLVVVPLDDEARALPGWHEDEDGLHRLFVLTPTWYATEVSTFNRRKR